LLHAIFFIEPPLFQIPWL